jgi:hypothetical protein
MNKLALHTASVLLALSACTVSTPPPQQPVQPAPAEPTPPPTVIAPQPPPPPPGGGLAADNGQPKMHAALNALTRAGAELQAASPNKGGHRERGLQMIQGAISEVKAGIDFANQHPTELGPPQPPAKNEPVPQQVAGADMQPHMAASMVNLREARRQLAEAEVDKGGHRVRAIEIIDDAMHEVHEGIMFANRLK